MHSIRREEWLELKPALGLNSKPFVSQCVQTGVLTCKYELKPGQNLRICKTIFLPLKTWL